MAPTTVNSISNTARAKSLVFDNGRLKTANFNTDQGFGLRAVAGEATGYAHSSELSEAALLRASDAVSAVKGGYSGTLAAAPARTNRHLYGEENPHRFALFRGEGEAAAGNRRLPAQQGSEGAPGDRLARLVLAACRNPARRRPGRARRAPAGAHERFGGRWRWRSPGDRLPRHGRAQGFRRVRRRGQLEVRRRRGAAAGAGQPPGDPRARRHVRHRAVLRLAGRDAA